MTRFNFVSLFLGLTVMAISLPLFGDENLKAPAQVTSTEHVDFAPGGVIRVNGSYGDLYIKGWDQPQVEMTVTKFMPYDYAPAHPERSAQHLEAVKVVTERRSPGELEISTTFPAGVGFPRHPTKPSKTGQVTTEYQIYVPAHSRLMIHHGVGLVSVTGVTGDIEATCHRGDIILWLPESGTYSIDAKNKLGKVSSDFGGSTLSRFLVGQKFVSVKPAPAQRLYLRMGFGGITIKPTMPESETKRPLTASAQ